jgi:hypothetical protein
MTTDRLWLNSETETRSVSKWLLAAGFGLAVAIVAVALTTPSAAGYERSVYGAFPAFFWVMVILALFLGQIVVLRVALERYPQSGSWRLGVVLIGVVEGLLVFMPYVRGYPVYGAADVLTHIGYVRTIEATGGDLFVNVYQNHHQLVLALSYATGVEPIHVINVVAGVASIFALVALVALLSAVFDRRRALLGLPFVAVLVGGGAHMNASPFAQTILLFPFVLYLFVRAQQTESAAYRASLAVATVGIITYHPLTGLFLVFVFGLHYAVVALTRATGDGPVAGISAGSSKLVAQLSLVTFVGWYYNFVGIFVRFEFVVEQVLGRGTGESELAQYSSTASQYSPSLSDIALFASVEYGATAVYLGVGVLFVVTTAWLYLRRRPVEPTHMVTWAFAFCLFSALGVLFLTTNLIGGFGRPLAFARLFAGLSAGALFYRVYVDSGRKVAVTVAASLALTVLVVLAVVSLYPSPLSGESNQQVTEHDIAGVDWYFENAPENASLDQYGVGMYRFEDARLSTESDVLPRDVGGPPAHFNYTNHDTLGASYDETRYLVVTKRARVFYRTTYPDYREFWDFTATDWARFERDPTVSHVYGNGEFDVYVVVPLDEADSTFASGVNRPPP